MFSDTLQPMRGKCLKDILKFLYCTKYSKINICHSDVSKHFSYKNDIKSTNILSTGLHKNFPMDYILRGKMFEAYFTYLY